MVTRYVKQFEMSKSDQNLIKSMVLMSVESFAEGDDERKNINILMNDRIILEPTMERIITTLKNIRERIMKKIVNFNKDFKISELPEFAAGDFSMVLRPREFAQLILDNYHRHTRNIDEILLVLFMESEPMEDEN